MGEIVAWGSWSWGYGEGIKVRVSLSEDHDEVSWSGRRGQVIMVMVVSGSWWVPIY